MAKTFNFLEDIIVLDVLYKIFQQKKFSNCLFYVNLFKIKLTIFQFKIISLQLCNKLSTKRLIRFKNTKSFLKISYHKSKLFFKKFFNFGFIFFLTLACLINLVHASEEGNTTKQKSSLRDLALLLYKYKIRFMVSLGIIAGSCLLTYYFNSSKLRIVKPLTPLISPIIEPLLLLPAIKILEEPNLSPTTLFVKQLEELANILFYNVIQNPSCILSEEHMYEKMFILENEYKKFFSLLNSTEMEAAKRSTAEINAFLDQLAKNCNWGG
jgi:hypothetical protein